MERQMNAPTFADAATMNLGCPRTAAFFDKCDRHIPWRQMADAVWNAPRASLASLRAITETFTDINHDFARADLRPVVWASTCHRAREYQHAATFGAVQSDLGEIQ